METTIDDIQQRIYDFIVKFKVENNGISPSYEEIADAVGRSKSNTYRHIEIMVRNGRIQMLGRFTSNSRKIIVPELEVRMREPLPLSTEAVTLSHA